MKLNLRRGQDGLSARLKLQKGVSLLEVLIAVLVLSVGLLGVAGLQTANIRNTQSAHQRTMAVLLASSMAERIRANAAAAGNGSFVLPLQCTQLSAGASIQSVEQSNWLNEILTTFGDSGTSCGGVTYNAGTRTYIVTVQWDDSRALGGSTTMTITHVARI
ncbi:type IV pilus modification protein PilV [Rheinheimera sp.]|uniref:type IV pilus modification protein PilV n=1 Tax=Rheinheimera sp. TaxID=1869214 RepID=UPI0027B8B6D9|nr:type IV pilus modification protein PilV [Rheinheimera sp.]